MRGAVDSTRGEGAHRSSVGVKRMLPAGMIDDLFIAVGSPPL
jgi:hypothetical protein